MGTSCIRPDASAASEPASPTTAPPARTFNRPDTAAKRELAARHSCDPRTIDAVLDFLEGKRDTHPRGMAGRRARAAVKAWLAEQATSPERP